MQSTIFALAAAVLTLFLRKHPARTQYWIWLAASIKFLVPFSLFVEIGHRLNWSTAPVSAQARLAFVMDEISQPFVMPELHAIAPARVASAEPIVSMMLLGI